MRLAKVFVAAFVLCVATQGQAKAQFTPPAAPAAYAPAFFSAATAAPVLTVGRQVFYKCTQSGATFSLPAGTSAAVVKLRASYWCAQTKYLIDCNYNAGDVNYKAAALNWFVLNVNPLYGF